MRAASIIWSKNDTFQNNRFNAGGLAPGSVLAQSTGAFTSTLTKAFATGGQMPNYAVFCVEVADVAGACAGAEAAGGKVLVPATPTENGLVFAHLADPSGNQFGVFSPPPAN